MAIEDILKSIELCLDKNSNLNNLRLSKQSFLDIDLYCDKNCRSLKEKISTIYHDIQVRLCKECRQPVSFNNFKTPYTQTFCCSSCAHKNESFRSKISITKLSRDEDSKKKTKEKIKLNYDLKTKEEKRKILDLRNKTLNFKSIEQKELEKQNRIKTLKSKSKEEKEESLKKKLKTISEKSEEQKLISSKNRILSIKKTIYQKLINSNRLLDRVLPAFKMEDYSNSLDEELSWICKTCDNVFTSSIANGRVPRCEICFPRNVVSFLEKEIVDWLKKLNIVVEENNRKIISPKEIDIFLPQYNLAIEFDGLYWHSELNGKDSNYHLDKTNLAKENGCSLIHVFELEWLNKREIVKSIIKSKLNIYDKKIGARETILKEISSKESSYFLEYNHLQGGSKASINIGLYCKEELVSVLTMSKPRFNKNYQWEISRFANKLNWKINGSFSKMWLYFLKMYEPRSCITYSDKRYFNGSVYRRYFKELEDTKPNYWYHKYDSLKNRIEFQKHKLKEKLDIFDHELDEWSNMQLNGYDRIWDCGNKKFEWRKHD